MNYKNFSFIIKVEDELSFEECSFYINNLYIPEDFSIDIIPVRGNNSVSKSYNDGLALSSSKYNIYLHDDVFIINRSFLFDILNIFLQNDSVGMIGVCGAKKLSSDGIWWNSADRLGELYESHTGRLSILKFRDVSVDFEEVECIDGLLMATQYSLPFRDDLFLGGHFYDIAQCMEFRNYLYSVVVPHQISPWCIHDCKVVNSLNEFNRNREIFLANYTF